MINTRENLKINVNSPEESKIFQDFCFQHGIQWKEDGVLHTNHNALAYKYLFTECKDGDWVIMRSNKKETFDKDSSTELSIETVLAHMGHEGDVKSYKPKEPPKPQASLKHKLDQKFVHVDDVVRILETAHTAGKNIMLYGRGGHAKSEITEEFLRHVDPDGSNSFVQACGEGLTEEKLFGGLNIKKFQDTGEVEYLVENSFMNFKYVVFEELLDSRMNVLLSLKDILTSKKFRQGSQMFPIKTEMIICLTNRTKQEVAEDNSIKALLERFPMELKVEWPSYETNDYKSMFMKVLNKDYSPVAELCSEINSSGDFVSPRTAVHMAQVYGKTGNLESLKFFGGMSSDIISKMEKIRHKKKMADLLNKINGEMDALLNASKGSIENMKGLIKKIHEKKGELQRHEFPDDQVKVYADIMGKADRYVLELKESIFQSI